MARLVGYRYDGTQTRLLHGTPPITVPDVSGTSSWAYKSAVTVSPATIARPAAGSIDPNTGAPYVTYESLYQSGDTVTEALNRLNTPAVVTFPEGLFTFSDFRAPTKTGVVTGGGINLEKTTIRGIWGSGPGDAGVFGGSSGTIFRMLPNTSTRADDPNYTPTQDQSPLTNNCWMMRAVGMEGGLTLKGFRLEGSIQGEGSARWPGGHNFPGITVFNTGGPVLIEDLRVSGWQGDNGAPPGECMGVSVYTPSAIRPVVIRRVETDGRRAIGGAPYGAVGISLGRTYGGLVEDCYMHDHRVSSMFVLYHAINSTVRRCIMGAPDGDLSGWAVNNECVDEAVYEDCYFGKGHRPLHFTHSNGTHVQTWGASSYPTADGSLLVKGCTWANVGYDGRFATESWISGIDGQTSDTQVTPPQVVNAAGQGLSFRWVHGVHQDIISPDL